MLLELGGFTVLLVGCSTEGVLIRAGSIDFTVARGEWLAWALVGLGQLSIDGEGQLVTAIVVEGARHVVLSLALGSTFALVTSATL